MTKPIVPDSCSLSPFASNSVPLDSMMLHPSACQNTINDGLADVSFSADSRSECDDIIIPSIPSSDNERNEDYSNYIKGRFACHTTSEK